MEKTSSRAGMAKQLKTDRELKKGGEKQVPVKGIGRLSDSPRAEKIRREKTEK